ncbi:MAG: response regulator transcription factor [Thiotrichales bacterium]|nr:response regulator transcription factor [Thiotrichales bacterium]
MKLLIVEDNEALLANLYAFLEPLGYQIDSARNGWQGLKLAQQAEYAALVLDVSLPGLDGFALCRILRQEYGMKTPILILTARDTIDHKVEGFESGADDYLVKPFSLVELNVRLHALVRRAQQRVARTHLQWGALSLNPQTREVRRSGVPVILTPIGYKIVHTLMRHAPNLVTRATLEQAVWGDEPPSSDALRSHLHTVRQTLDKPFGLPLLKTVPGVGYQLVKADEKP